MSKKTPNKVKSNQVAPKSTTPAKKGITNAKNLMQTKSNTAPVNAKQEEKIEQDLNSKSKDIVEELMILSHVFTNDFINSISKNC